MTEETIDESADQGEGQKPTELSSESPQGPLDAEMDEAEGADPEPVDPLEEAIAAATQMKDKLMRMAADYDNYRKRSRREVIDAGKKGRDGLLTDLLPVFDNLERAAGHAEGVLGPDTSGAAASDANLKGLVDGITLVMKQFRDALGRLGIERVESVGQAFDPSLHEAIQHLETTEVPPGCIAAEVQSGYKDGDRLIRAAMVVVAKTPVSSTPPPESSEGQSPDA